MSYPIPPGGLAAVLAHPDDESVGCAGALALANAGGQTTRLLVATRGEAGAPDGAWTRRLRGHARGGAHLRGADLGLDEVSILDGYPDGGVADEPFARLVTRSRRGSRTGGRWRSSRSAPTG